MPIKKLQIGIPFYNEKNFRPLLLTLYETFPQCRLSLSLSLSISHPVSPFLKSLEIIDLPYLAFQRYDIMPCPHSCFGSCTYIILKLELVISIIEGTYSI